MKNLTALPDKGGSRLRRGMYSCQVGQVRSFRFIPFGMRDLTKHRLPERNLPAISVILQRVIVAIDDIISVIFKIVKYIPFRIS